MTVYDFIVKDNKGNEVKLDKYKGKVLLIINTATRCGFTPTYDDIEKLYEEYKDKGLEILDFPCNQLLDQAPESDEEIDKICTLKFNTKFPRFKKIDVNGKNEDKLYTFLKSKEGFKGFDEAHKLTPILKEILSEADPDYASKSDIKWNFTKFLIDRKGNVVARFEPTTSFDVIKKEIEKVL